MRIFLTAFILLCTCQLSAQVADLDYAGRDWEFYKQANRDDAKKEIRYTAGPFLGTSKEMIGSGFVSEMGSKESKITGQLFCFLADMTGDMLAVNLKFGASTDNSFYRTNAIERPTFSFSAGVFLLLAPGKWCINENDYLGRAKNPTIKYADADAIKTSYKWFHLTGGYNDGRLKMGALNNSVFEPQIELLRTKNIGVSYNRLRVYNSDDYKIRVFKSTLFSIGVEWPKLTNLRKLTSSEVITERIGVDASGAAVYVNQDMGNYYQLTAQSPFVHFYETVYKMQYTAETVTGWVISAAVNYHMPRENEDDPTTPHFNEVRKEYVGFEGGIHYSAKNKAGKSIANIGVYGDYNYSNLYDHWIVSLRTSFPINF